MKYADVRPKIQTGDVVLSSGSSVFSKIIKELTGCPWSHVAMAVWGEHVGMESGRLYVWEAAGHGVGAVDFETACYTPGVNFLSRLTNYQAGDVAWRPLAVERTAEMMQRLRVHCDVYRGIPYETNKLEMLKAVPWVRLLPLATSEKNLASQFCWESVAAIHQAMGLLPDEPQANYYSNVDYSGNDMPFLLGARLGGLVKVDFSER